MEAEVRRPTMAEHESANKRKEKDRNSVAEARRTYETLIFT